MAGAKGALAPLTPVSCGCHTAVRPPRGFSSGRSSLRVLRTGSPREGPAGPPSGVQAPPLPLGLLQLRPPLTCGLRLRVGPWSHTPPLPRLCKDTCCLTDLTRPRLKEVHPSRPPSCSRSGRKTSVCSSCPSNSPGASCACTRHRSCRRHGPRGGGTPCRQEATAHLPPPTPTARVGQSTGDVMSFQRPNSWPKPSLPAHGRPGRGEHWDPAPAGTRASSLSPRRPARSRRPAAPAGDGKQRRRETGRHAETQVQVQRENRARVLA